MYLDRLMNQGSVPVLEQLLNLPTAVNACLARTSSMPRHPNYVQKDLSLEQFQLVLRRKVEQEQFRRPGQRPL